MITQTTISYSSPSRYSQQLRLLSPSQVGTTQTTPVLAQLGTTQTTTPTQAVTTQTTTPTQVATTQSTTQTTSQTTSPTQAATTPTTTQTTTQTTSPSQALTTQGALPYSVPITLLQIISYRIESLTIKLYCKLAWEASLMNLCNFDFHFVHFF